MEIISNINDYFLSKLNNINTKENETKAYIISIFKKYETANEDISKKSLTLEFIKAKELYDFAAFQNIGDWVFWNRSLYNNIQFRFYDDIARISYYKCYIILNKKWKVFEEMSDNFIYLARDINNKLNF